MEYTIVTAITIKELIVEVQKLIGEGWVPVGGVSTTNLEAQSFIVQAMTRG